MSNVMGKPQPQPKTLSSLRRVMRRCEQTKGMSVLEHGVSVARYYRDLVNHIKFGSHLRYQWRLPDWIYSLEIKDALLDDGLMLSYHLYHDCGKPYSRVIDDNGKVHFPNHSEVSYNTWNEIGRGGEYHDDIAWLILHDMDMHLAKPKDAGIFVGSKYWASQLLTALSEVHSNSGMFGGIESTSFKIKYKNINKLGKRMLDDMMCDE